MAKRFIDTAIFSKGLVRGLQGANKLLWIYLITHCDHSGIWDVFPDEAELKTGFKYDWDDVQVCFGEKIVIIDDGKKWFIPGFIEFQYNSMELNPANKTHNSVLRTLSKYNLTDQNKVLTSPLQGAKDKDTDKDKELDRDKDQDPEILTGESVKTILGENRKPESRADTPRLMLMRDDKFLQALRIELKLDPEEFDHRLQQFSLKRTAEGTLYTEMKQVQADLQYFLNNWERNGTKGRRNGTSESKPPTITEIYGES